MTQKSKMIIYAIVAILVIAIATTATIWIINSNNNKKITKSNTTPTTSSSTPTSSIPATNKPVSTLQTEAVTASKAGNQAEAVTLLTQAQQQLSEQPKSDANTNAEINVAAQQCMQGVKSACKGY
ncbi:MAG TPA: hypothetical protein VMR16_03945 [Candidatus Saccharimonadales bacterium]|nr:hypothetical protein [Candidatus Saccharimonadales bacterium]